MGRKELEFSGDGLKLLKVSGVEVNIEICPYDSHPDKTKDQRILGYHEQELDGCINCCFRHRFKTGDFEIGCGRTLDEKGYFSGVSPLGKCQKYEKGESLFPW